MKPSFAAWFALALGIEALTNAGMAFVPIRLDQSPAPSASVHADFQFSGNGEWVVYRASDESRDALYCLSTNGGNPTALSGDLATGGLVQSWQLSQDGNRVIYLADQETLGLTEVFVVSMPDGVVQKLNGPLVEHGSTRGAFADAAGSRIAFIAGEISGDFTGTFYELFSVPASGGESNRLSGPLVTGGDVAELFVRTDGERILYLADQDIDETWELYSASLGGGSPVKLNGPLASGGDVLADGIAFSPIGDRAVYVADQEQDQRFELYSVPTLGGTPVRLNAMLANGGDVTPGSQRFSPDGARVLFHADQDEDDVFEIYSVPSGGGTTQRLNGELVHGGDVNWRGVQFNLDGTRVLYTADQLVNEKHELFSVPADGGAATRLSGDLVSDGDVVDDAVFSPDGSRVLYRADQFQDETVELFSVPSIGGLAVRLNNALVAGGDVLKATFSPDSNQVIFLADQDVDDVFELFAVPSSGGDVRRISGPMTLGGDVTDWQFSPDGRTLVYRADQEIDGQFELFAVAFSDDLPGDFNRDGIVDAADYTVWRDGLDTGKYRADEYGVWKSNFGRRAGDGAGAAVPLQSAVPEPAAWLLASGAILALVRRGRRRELIAR